MRNVDCPSSFPQLRKANQGFNPITSLSPIFVEAVLDEYVELVSEALLEKVAEAICEKLKRQLVQEKYKFFCTKFTKFCANFFVFFWYQSVTIPSHSVCERTSRCGES